MALTVGELRKAMEGLPDDRKVVAALSGSQISEFDVDFSLSANVAKRDYEFAIFATVTHISAGYSDDHVLDDEDEDWDEDWEDE